MLQGPGERLMGMDWEKRVVFPRLHLTGQLAKTLKEADPARTDLHEGMEATKQALLGLDLCQYSAIVFATHGYFNRDMPGIQEPLMVLTLLNLPNGQDGFLRASEVSALKLRADLVVLLACDSGLGNFAPRIGTNSIANSFLWAGARSVIAKLWCGAEKPSVMLVESFFKHLREGKSKLQALRLARHETRKSGYDHPFFWAPFILVGEVE